MTDYILNERQEGFFSLYQIRFIDLTLPLFVQIILCEGPLLPQCSFFCTNKSRGCLISVQLQPAIFATYL